MKHLLFIAAIIFALTAKSQDSIQAEITNWYQGKKAAIVFSFDDWSPGHGTIVYPLFKQNKVPATFYITTKNSYLSGGYATMRNAFEDGFEIGNHTATHPDLTKISAGELVTEVIGAQKTLRDSVHPKCANTFAFPFGIFDSGVMNMVKSAHIGSRLATLRYGRVWPYSLTYGKTDYYQLQTFMARDIYTPATYERLTKQAIAQGGMITFMYHSVYNDSVDDHWFGAISESTLNAHLQAVKKHKDSVWITTFEKALAYHQARKKSTITTTISDSTILIKLVVISLPEENINQPLSVQIKGIDDIEKILDVVNDKNEKIPVHLIDGKLYLSLAPVTQSITISL